MTRHVLAVALLATALGACGTPPAPYDIPAYTPPTYEALPPASPETEEKVGTTYTGPNGYTTDSGSGTGGRYYGTGSSSRGTYGNPVYVTYVPHYYHRVSGKGPILFGMGFGGKSYRRR